ncbi:hypothetical protein GNI_106230 [Gregarina niphandrodes]|uniref:Uncharacterized protein n=1 Tax=Gregarina niphandrodes TaxID=110365 RepID=A0A023B3W6_GRENI|nr:hypothetical protein GNI_106230 [Gregarina niphandrodes]EZG56028.1 hypothetical protein GNI_106230 [Gregarina niphandrodes]|eukprot:XP_011131369.1 hypothetical protein GNI_106230 [Gregarina niphandrodes]
MDRTARDSLEIGVIRSGPFTPSRHLFLLASASLLLASAASLEEQFVCAKHGAIFTIRHTDPFQNRTSPPSAPPKKRKKPELDRVKVKMPGNNSEYERMVEELAAREAEMEAKMKEEMEAKMKEWAAKEAKMEEEWAAKEAEMKAEMEAKEKEWAAKMEEELEALRHPAIANFTPGAISDNPRADASAQLAAKAFDVEYRTPHLAVDDAFQLFAQVADSTERVDVVALCQSSGFGKSRLLKEVSKRYYTCYMSLPLGQYESRGYPMPTARGRQFMSRLLRVNKCLDDEVAVIERRYMEAIVEEVALMVEACIAFRGTAEEWYRQSVTESDLEEASPGAQRSLPDLLARFSSLKGYPLVFMLDEAGALLPPSVIETSYFRLVRRALAIKGISLVCASTNSKVQNFAPSLHSDTSAKMLKRKSTPPRPLLAISTRDAFANLQLPVTLSEAASPGYCVSFGRPMWMALFGAMGDDVDAADLRKFAADKIAAYGSLNTEGACFAAAAILGVLRIRPSVAVAESLVSHHMATLLHVSDDRELLYVGYDSDPNLAEGAMSILFQHEQEVLKSVVKAVGCGTVDKGNMGEFYCRLLLARARAGMKSSTSSVHEFRCAVFGGSSEVHDDPRSNFTGTILFNHFATCPPPYTQERLRAAFLRRAAIIPALENQKAVDLIIPVFHGGSDDDLVEADKMGAIAVQVKNCKQPLNATVLLESMEEYTGGFPIPWENWLVMATVQRRSKGIRNLVTFEELMTRVAPSHAWPLWRALLAADLSFNELVPPGDERWTGPHAKFFGDWSDPLRPPHPVPPTDKQQLSAQFNKRQRHA